MTETTSSTKASGSLRRVLWSLLSSSALHSAWVAALFLGVVYFKDKPPQTLVDYEAIEFSENSASAAGDEGNELDEPDDSLEEQEELVTETRQPVNENAEKDVLDDIEEKAQETVEKTAKAITDSDKELTAGQSADLANAIQDVEQGSAEALQIARIAKQRMKLQLEALKGGKAKKAGVKIPTTLERVKSRGDLKYLHGLQAEDILVVSGSYDAVENVLKFLAVPYRITKKARLDTMVLNPKMVIIFNCDHYALSRKAVSKIRTFVKRGGYVFSSDWELSNVIERAFPSAIRKATRVQPQRVNIRPHPKHKNHPYLRDVFTTSYGITEKTVLRWKVDGASDYPRFLSEKVLPLVVSKEMAVYGAEGAIAFTYKTGTGSILHVLSHFKSQSDPNGDGFALQQMLANFIIEKQKARLKIK
ncbi:MAG: hypothetical protein P1V97_19210 [Planctomycetota bacterium]|nr:hypothetical protein [Planctomycetota bacterium]